jgi:hypothetical protein
MHPCRQALGAVFFLTAIVFAGGDATASNKVESAAKRFEPTISWRANSVLDGNFSCKGRREKAILGTSKSEIVIAVFLHGLTNKPEILRFSATSRRLESVTLIIESLDFTTEEFEGEVESVPSGLQPSKVCVGLNLSDQLTDSTHVYWNRKTARFESWSQ